MKDLITINEFKRRVINTINDWEVYYKEAHHNSDSTEDWPLARPPKKWIKDFAKILETENDV